MSSMPMEMPARVGVVESQILDLIEHLHGDRQAELQVGVLHELGEALLLRRPLMKGISSGSASLKITRPTVVSMSTLLYSAGSVCITFWLSKALPRSMTRPVKRSLNGGEGLDFAHLERDQHVLDRGEFLAFALWCRGAPW